MAKPTKKTLEEIAAENNIDISEENAQTVANNYIQPTIDAINQAEQDAIASTQAARKALENDYFKQYTASRYNAQSRGLTGGLASMGEQQLRMQLGQANADLSKDLITAQRNAETNRGTALTTAQNYKTDYLQNIRDKVTALREQDYAQRYAEWQFAEQQAQAQREFEENQRRWQLEYNLSLDRYNMEKDQFEYEKSQRETSNKQADLQYAANVQEYLNMVLPDVANTYISYMASGDVNKAADYLGRTAAQLNKNYGANMNDVISQVGSIYNYNRALSDINKYTPMAQRARTGNILGTLGSGVLKGASFALAPLTGGLSLLGLPISSLGTYGAIKGQSNYDNYMSIINRANKTVNNTVLPSWYQQ